MPPNDIIWMKKLVTANGLSSSHLIYKKNGEEDKFLSRRVEFRVRTNAEKQLEDIANKRLINKKKIMEDIYALLNINKGILQDFHLQADRAVDHQTELAINRDMRTLKEIEERMMTDTAVKVSQQTIDEVIMKVIKNARRITMI